MRERIVAVMDACQQQGRQFTWAIGGGDR
jgi:hypothetical protein